ncbi:MAG: ankyrin repeat domain-containing protein [Saprospiraceae bacterium]
MSILKIVTILNWIVIAILTVLVALAMISPTKGGDPAGRGMGQLIQQLAIIWLFVLLGLNLLPYNWAKYTAFALILAPFAYIKFGSAWSSLKQKVASKTESSKSMFEDKERESIARAIYEGKTETVKKILQNPVPRLNEDGELLRFVVTKTASSNDKIEERMACIRLLFQAGARLDSTNGPGIPPLHIAIAETGNAPLLRLLLEHGADANTNYDKRPILFEAVGSYLKTDAAARVLLEFGADPNATAVLDDEQGPITPLLWAAINERWGACATLLEKGANPDFKAADGTTFQKLFQEGEITFSPNAYTTREDFERLKKILK